MMGWWLIRFRVVHPDIRRELAVDGYWVRRFMNDNVGGRWGSTSGKIGLAQWMWGVPNSKEYCGIILWV